MPKSANSSNRKPKKLPAFIIFMLLTALIAGIAFGLISAGVFESDSSQTNQPPTAKDSPANTKQPPSGEVSTTKAPALKIGHYVTFGKYAGEPIKWRVINLDASGNPLLFSDRILTLKAYNPFSTQEFGEQGYRGINDYQDSTLRQWLNSSEQRIKWLNVPPTADQTVGANMEDGQLMPGNFPYAEERGFLADENFSAAERSWIKPHTHRVMLANRSLSQKQGGSEFFKYNNNATADTNYNSAYYTEVTDSVFSLSVEQLKTYVYNKQAFLGSDYWKSPLPDKLKNNKVFKDCCSAYIEDEFKDHWPYWLNTVDAGSADSALTVEPGGKLYPVAVAQSYIGVRPALYLDMKKVRFSQGGEGSGSKPYVARE